MCLCSSFQYNSKLIYNIGIINLNFGILYISYVICQAINQRLCQREATLSLKNCIFDKWAENMYIACLLIILSLICFAGVGKMEKHETVSIVRCESYEKDAVSSAVENSFEHFGGIGNFIKKGSKVLVKPNLIIGSDPSKCAITHHSVLEAVTEKVLEFGAIPVIGDSPAFGSVLNIAKRAGFDKFAKKHGIDIVELDCPRTVRTRCGEKPFSLTVSGRALDVDAIINVPKLKAHMQFLFTGAVKNMYGCVSGKRKAWRHLISNNNIEWYAEMLLANYHAVKPVFTIVDAVMAMEKTGPTKGVPRKVSLIVSGIDCVAIDRVMAEIINVRPSDAPLLRTAKSHNVGVQDLDMIEILGERLESVKIKDFLLPELKPVGFSPMQVCKSVIRHLWLKKFDKVA